MYNFSGHPLPKMGALRSGMNAVSKAQFCQENAQDGTLI